MKRLIPLGLALFPLALVAAVANVTWVNPTQNTDGTAIPASGDGAISSTRIEYGTCNSAAFGTKTGEVVVQGAATAGSITGLTPGVWCARAFTRNSYGVESDPSNVAQKVVAAPKPKPPTNFSLD